MPAGKGVDPVTLKVFNVLGQEIKTLISENLGRGDYSYLWNAGNLPGGIYYYQIVAGKHKQVKKMLLLR